MATWRRFAARELAPGTLPPPPAPKPDPMEVMDQLASALQRAGLRAVDGNVIGDDTFFLTEPYGRAWAKPRSTRPPADSAV